MEQLDKCCSVSLSVSPKCRNHITVLSFIMSVYQITWWTRLSHSGTVLWLSPGSAPHFSWKKCNMSVFVLDWAGREQLSELYRQSLTILRVFFLFSQKTRGCLKKPLMHRMQFSCMCYIPVTAHHAHDLFIDVLLVVFLWQHSGLLWNIYIYLFLSLHCLVKTFF